jgi:hypothetical protein
LPASVPVPVHVPARPAGPAVPTAGPWHTSRSLPQLRPVRSPPAGRCSPSGGAAPESCRASPQKLHYRAEAAVLCHALQCSQRANDHLSCQMSGGWPPQYWPIADRVSFLGAYMGLCWHSLSNSVDSPGTGMAAQPSPPLQVSSRYCMLQGFSRASEASSWRQNSGAGLALVRRLCHDDIKIDIEVLRTDTTTDDDSDLLLVLFLIRTLLIIIWPKEDLNKARSNTSLQRGGPLPSDELE